jgi:hypothetical protein
MIVLDMKIKNIRTTTGRPRTRSHGQGKAETEKTGTGWGRHKEICYMKMGVKMGSQVKIHKNRNVSDKDDDFNSSDSVTSMKFTKINKYFYLSQAQISAYDSFYSAKKWKQ